MAGNSAAGCAGWGFAGFLLLVLMGQCVSGGSSKPATPQGFASIPVSQSPSTWRYVQAATLNCRADQSTSAPALRQLSTNDCVGILDEQGGWSKVQGSPECWVRSSYLADTRKYVPPPKATPQRAYSSERSSRSSSSTSRRSSGYGGYADTCPCSGSNVCIGPRGGRFCITSGGNKRYGV